MGIYFGYPTQEKFNLNLDLPEGYSIESLPKPVRIATEDKAITYIFNISHENNKIQISCIKEINNSIFAADEYNGLKDIFQKILASQNEKIVLKKI